MSCPVCSSQFVVIERETPPRKGFRQVAYRCTACGSPFVVEERAR